MRFIGKVTAPLEDIAHDVNESVAHASMNIDRTAREVSAMAGLGIIAFALVSVVAVSALLIATKRSVA